MSSDVLVQEYQILSVREVISLYVVLYLVQASSVRKR